MSENPVLLCEPEPEDRDLVRLALEDDGQAFALLVERYFAMVVALGIARLGEREAAEEMAQEVFMRAFLHLEKLRDGKLFAAWLTRITRNLAEDWARTQQRASRAIATLCLDDLPGEVEDRRSGDPCEHAIARQQSHILSEAVLGLPPHLRDIVLLHYVEDLEKVEIARRLGMHASSVGRRLDRALELLRCSFEEPAAIAAACRPSKRSYERTRTIGVALAGLSLAGRANAAQSLTPAIPAKVIAITGSPSGSATPFLDGLAMLIEKLKILLSRITSMQVTLKGVLGGAAVAVVIVIACYYGVSKQRANKFAELAATANPAAVGCNLMGLAEQPEHADGQAPQYAGTPQSEP